MNRYLNIFLLLVFFTSCYYGPTPARGCVDIVVADTCYAGDELRLQIKSRRESHGDVYIFIDDSRGIEMVNIKMGKDTLLKRQFKNSGIVKIQSFVNSTLCSVKQIYISPLHAARPLSVYLGPKSIKTGGEDSTMMTIIPMDTFGNLLPDTTRVGFSIIHPDKAGTSGKDRLYGGIAAVDISGGTISGKGFAMATVGAVASREMDFLEVSGDPIDFRIKASVHSTFADGRQTFKIFSDRLVDKYGNILPEGSIVYFNCYEGNDSIRTITGYTIGGIATIYLQNPVRTGVFKVNAVTATGAESNTVVLVFNTPKFEY